MAQTHASPGEIPSHSPEVSPRARYENPIQRPAAATVSQSAMELPAIAQRCQRSSPAAPAINRFFTPNVNTSASPKAAIFTQKASLK